MDILKTQQVNIGSTTLDTRELPDEDEEDCLNRLIALKNKINNYKFNLEMPPWFPKIIDWQEGFYLPNKVYTIEGHEKWNEALLRELYKINPEWRETIEERHYDGLIDIHTYSHAYLDPMNIPENVACEILKVIDNPEDTDTDWALFPTQVKAQKNVFDGDWAYYMDYRTEPRGLLNTDYGKKVILIVRNEDARPPKVLEFIVELDNHPDVPFSMDKGNTKLILNYDEIDVDWTKW
tara:strand:- start:6664 stop:7371 length:708 start_codon:yes stop_codon:yes gene_type:complete